MALTKVSKADLEELFRKGMATAANPAAIEAYEQRRREMRDREALELWSRVAKEVRPMVPLRPELHEAVAEYHHPHKATRKGPVLKRTDALAITREWLSAPRSVLCMVSKSPGRGKTTAAAFAAFQTRLRGGTALYVKEPTLLRWSKYVRGEASLAAALSASLLIIDELGTCHARDVDDARMAVLAMVDDRLSVGRTMLLGNFGAADVATRYDARLMDRLTEVGVVAELGGESMRART